MTRNHSHRQSLRVLVSGPGYFVHPTNVILSQSGKLRVKTIELSRIRSRLWKAIVYTLAIMSCDVCYHIGGAWSWTRELAWRIPYLLRVPLVVHWIGTDVMLCAEWFQRRVSSLRLAKRFVHLADAPWLVDELAEVGIQAQFAPVVSEKLFRYLGTAPPGLPDSFTVLAYMADDRAVFYGWQGVLQLAKDFPEIEILIARAVGAFAKEHPPNIKFLGWIDNMRDVYERCTVLVRMTEHDGLSNMIQEALALGRHAVWTYRFPGVLHAVNYLSLRNHIEVLLSLHQRQLLKLNKAGREFLQQNLDPADTARRVEETLWQSSQRGRPH
jgi:glycosyltransferase involved in cell wall biosynthesis